MGFSLTSGAGVDGNAPYQAQELQITTLANPNCCHIFESLYASVVYHTSILESYFNLPSQYFRASDGPDVYCHCMFIITIQ